MEYKKTLIILILTIFLFGIASVCAGDANDTAIAGEDISAIELAQGNEISVNDNSQSMEQSGNEEIISESDDGSFTALKSKIDNAPANSTITLENNYEYLNENMRYGIPIEKPITIDGQGKTIDAKQAAKFFEIKSAGVVLKNIIFVNGICSSTSHDGGGIYWEGDNAVIFNCSFVNNLGKHDGGTIYLKGNNAVVSNCSFINSTGNDDGGTIYLKGNNAVVSNCSFENSTSKTGTGTIFLNGNNCVISNCSFVKSSVYKKGGALYLSGDNCAVSNCSFLNSTARNEGGAIYMKGGNGAVSNCSFENGSSESGSGLYLSGGNNIVFNCSFLNGRTQHEGGAVWLGGDDSVMSLCSFVNNSAQKEGGAVYFRSSKGIISVCSFVNNSAREEGGAVYFIRNDGIVSLCSFVNNSAQKGGSVYWSSSGSKGTLSNCSFTNSSSTNRGGAVYWDGSIGTISHCSFINSSSTNRGGAVFWNERAGTISHCSFTNSNSTRGGTIYWENIKGTVSHCSFINSSSEKEGGAIYWTYKEGTVSSCSFVNTSSADNGGAIYWKSDEGTVSLCSFVNTSSTYDGGAIYWSGNEGVISNSRFIYCCGSYGGAIYLNDTNSSVFDCIFINDTADVGIIYFNNVNEENLSYFKINNNIFLNNAGRWGISFNKVDNSSNADYNWFGNNATDYDEAPPISGDGICNVWLFINVTADPSRIAVLDSADIIFKLSSYDSTSKSISDYDNAPIENLNLTVAAANGNISKNIVKMGETNKFTLTECEMGRVTATVENVVQSIDIGVKGDFELLQELVNNNSAPLISLEHNYTYNKFDTITEGVLINRTITINGNGFTIDAKGKSRVFNVEASDVTIENLTIKNAVVNGNGGAVYFNESGRVIKCNFTDNQATGSYPNGNGGAIYFAEGSTGNVTNCNFVNNTAKGTTYGAGAIYFNNGEVTNCNFTGNNATRNGGAVYFWQQGNVRNCNFTNNTANEAGGAVYFNNYGEVTNCNLTNNRATGDDSEGGAIYMYSGNVRNCNFTNNTANEAGGAIHFGETGTVLNCNFTGNTATWGSAIYFFKFYSYNYLTISNSTFLNNRANADDNTPFNLTINENNITITFMGQNNLINAIYIRDNTEVTFNNVTYWGEKGIATISSTKSGSNREAGQNITIAVVVNDKLVFNDVEVTDENGTIVLDVSVGENYYISVRHDEDSYYTEAEKTIQNMKFYVNVTETETTNKTVNITAKSNIKPEVISGNLQFVLPNGVEINATYASNGIWWATYTFDEYRDYQVSASCIGLSNLTINNATIIITKANSTVDVGDVVLNYGESINVTPTAIGATGIIAMIDNNPVSVINNFTISISGLDAGTYTLTVTTIADEDHNNVTKNATVTVNRIKTVLDASEVTATYNIDNDLVITLKDINGNPLTGVKVTVNLNGAKTYLTDKNGQVKVATKGLIPKTYTAKITFSGDSNHVESAKDVKVTVKKAKAKIIAKNKTFKKSKKSKKYTITLKDNTGKPIKKAKVTLKVKGKNYKAKTNSKGKATFKIKNLNKKGTFKAVITYKGNKYYNKVTKKSKIKVIVTFKTVSKGSKDKSTIKDIQKALKDHRYYLTYKGHYLKIDGIYHGCTERSVKEFQHDNGLKVTGKVDEKTAHKLEII